MRILEIALIVSLAIYFIGSFLKKRNRTFGLTWILYVALIISILHIFIEGSRWQMYIVYAITLLLFVSLILRKTGIPNKYVTNFQSPLIITFI